MLCESLKGVPKIPARKFTYDKYRGLVGFSDRQLWDDDKNKPTKIFTPIGYCHSSDLEFKPRNGEEDYAVLGYINDPSYLDHDVEYQEVWLHIFIWENCEEL